MRSRPLGDVQVVECGDEPALRYCGRLFQKFGATVSILAGQRRSTGVPATEAYLDDGKERASRDDLAASGPVVLLGDHTTDWARSPSHYSLRGEVLPFGPDPGVRANWSVNELVLACLGGATDFTTSPDGQPLYGFGHRFQFLAGMYLYFGLTMRLAANQRAVSDAPDVTVSLLETVASMLPCHTTQWEYNGNTDPIGQTGSRHVLACVDGWVAIYAGGPWRHVADFLGEYRPTDETRYVANGSRVQNSRLLQGYLERRVRVLTVAEAMDLGHQTNVAVAEIPETATVLADAEFAARDLWECVELPDGRRGRAPRPGFLIDGRRP
ncbi:crotonobetainyl-CoA:carnitine CoA-transferase CaiB-like acyl-CoA transferase [Tamaricihabitans halophyticus]|uniref:Crotonobetainyl-CoA:carnitine CoA-transferase CaiB-like acyl-CoA transferase n=1 Tax=Tamaricihabitans halophyticus TaxID=1262583 RepID=A0A4R2QFC2_9PSEU|nr:CoA transferase [Tamaricihabitans halophyticus]TCP47832.1 crotonobetainyl-CoA:carnitine CoA-transferase CaiB-like acyl-CoA transferase [Tamaricihabitans halophyticus]